MGSKTLINSNTSKEEKLSYQTCHSCNNNEVTDESSRKPQLIWSRLSATQDYNEFQHALAVISILYGLLAVLGG
jgi:hypothetical protein